MRASLLIDRANIKQWSHICCLSYRRFAQHIATLPQKPAVQCILPWCLAGTFRLGRPRLDWESQPRTAGTMDWCCCFESQRLESTLRIVHQILLSRKRFGLNLCHIHLHLIHFAPAPRKGSANGVEAWLNFFRWKLMIWWDRSQKFAHCKAFTVLWICDVISGLVRWQKLRYQQSTLGASQQPFLNKCPSAWYRINTGMARNTLSMQHLCGHTRWQSQH